MALSQNSPPPRHIAIIMDGNGRWAKQRGLPRTAGHAAGAEAFRRIANYCRTLGVEYLTVYAFSTENWKRSAEEVAGIMKLLRRYLEEGMNIGLGSDVAGGTSENLFAAMAQSIQASKLRWRLLDASLKPLTIEEAFYMATKGGGAFFGKVGSFEPGYEFDAVVCDDSRLEHPQPLTVKQRLERIIYLGDEREVAGKYVEGRKLF